MHYCHVLPWTMVLPSIPQSIVILLVKHKRKHKNRGRQVNDARLGLCVVNQSTNLTQKIVRGTFEFHVFLSSSTKLSMLRKYPILFKCELQQNLSAKKILIPNLLWRWRSKSQVMALLFHPQVVRANDKLNATLITANICPCIFFGALDMEVFVV